MEACYSKGSSPSEGRWTTEFYETNGGDPILTIPKDDLEGEGAAFKVHIDIKLSYLPAEKHASSTIRMVQFKNLPSLGKIWHVDRNQRPNAPWFGFELGSSGRFETEMVAASIFAEDKKGKGFEQFLKDEVTDERFWKAQQADGRGGAAFIIDNVRDLSFLEKKGKEELEFVTFAYDCDRKCWLGGVIWGATVNPPVFEKGGEATVQIEQWKIKQHRDISPLKDANLRKAAEKYNIQDRSIPERLIPMA